MTEDDDDLLIERLRSIGDRVDPVPDLVGTAGRAALSTRRLDSALAELVTDSLTGAASLARAPGDEQIRLLSFEYGAVAVELQVHHAAGTVAIRGLVSGATGEVVVESAAGRHPTPIDADGWFTVSGLPPGRLRLRLWAGDTAVTTSWVTL
jgi:hypothetical protein